MPDFSVRSTSTELMDNFSMPQKELNVNLMELETINRWLGGYSVSFEGIRRLGISKGSEITVADIGCGGGDGMIAIYNFCRKIGVRVRMIGVDANPKAINYARTRCREYPDFTWLATPFQELDDLKADVFHTSLFAHHFYDHDLKNLASLLSSARIGFVINDLHRHWLAYYSIAFLTKAFSGSYLVRNDAKLSVAKGFSKSEMEEFGAAHSGFELGVSWKWAFRWLLTGKRIRSNAH